MTKETLEQDIIRQITDDNGILVLLRERSFDVAKYQAVRDSIIRYRDLIKDETMINKQVAGCLWMLESMLMGTVMRHDREKVRSEQASSIGNAHAEIWEMLNDIFLLNDPMLGE